MAASLLAEATHRSDTEPARLVARRFPKPDLATAVRPLADAIPPPASRTAQVVANIASQLSPVTVVPMTFDETAKPMEPLCAGDETRTVHRVVPQVVAAAAAKRGSESVPQAMLASIADAVARTIVNAAAPVTPAADSHGAPPARVTLLRVPPTGDPVEVDSGPIRHRLVRDSARGWTHALDPWEGLEAALGGPQGGAAPLRAPRARSAPRRRPRYCLRSATALPL